MTDVTQLEWATAQVRNWGNRLASILDLHRAPAALAFLRGVNAAVVALILAVAVALFRSAVGDIWTAVILVVSLAVLLRFRLNALWLVLGGAACGLVQYLLVGP